VQIFTFNLRDRIEWDLCSHLTPEQFTEAYCAEIGLTGEAKPIIAHAIHEELLKHKKDAYEAKLYGPGALQMEDRKNAPMKLKEVWRDWDEKEEFGPAMIPLRMDELIQKEQERDRAARCVLDASASIICLTLLLSGVCDERHPAFRIQLVVARVIDW
jgi:chromatin structure-remodeling complex subunit SFH1